MKYGSKHPADALPDPLIASALEAAAASSRVSCSQAHALATALNVSPAEIGRNMDLLELRIVECQMGIFGHQPQKKILKPAASVPEELSERLREVAPEGVVSCATCWKVARESGLEKMAVAAACEHLGLKIKPCQLGAF